MNRFICACIFVVAVVVAMPSWAKAFTFPDPTTNAMLYGDFYSYSLPILAYQYDQEFGGGVGPGNPYYVQSTPGHISDSIVIATGASGIGVNTNFPGMDNAYPTPNSSGVSTFSTGTTPDPGFTPTMPANQADTWDSTIEAFMGQMGGQSPAFFFNNNQERSEQDLWAYGQVKVWSSAGGATPEYFDLASPNGDGTGIFGGDPATYVSPTYSDASWEPTPFEDYIISGGDVCLNASGIPVPCGSPDAVEGPFPHNLGADQAAYAIFSPELNAMLAAWNGDSPYDMISMDFRMHSLNSGYEQAFVMPAEFLSQPVPEPSSVLLMGLGFTGLVLVSMRRRFRRD
jgi:hypothetical protein